MGQGTVFSRKEDLNRYKERFACILILPVVLYVLAFIVYPVFCVFQLSLTDKVLTDPGSGVFVGLASYKAVFTNPVTYTALKNTVTYVLGGVILTMILGVLTGQLLSIPGVMTNLTAGLILIPWALPPVIIASVWKWMLHPQLGLINDILLRIRLISETVPFLSDPKKALIVLVVILAWRLFPFEGIMISAGIKGIPAERYEAAVVDGANAIQRFLYITVPGIKYMLMTTSLMNTIWILNSIALVLIMTGGGPLHYTELLSTFLYKTGFQYYKFGEAAVLSVLNFLIILVLSIVYLYLFRDSWKRVVSKK